MHRPLVLCLLLLAACSPREAGDAPSQPTAQAAAPARVTDFSQDIEARGTEPFWALKIHGGALTLTRPDQPELTAQAPGAKIVPGRAAWTAQAADGRTLTATLYVSDCSDGMSDVRYPMAAEVKLGSETFNGCAAKAADMPPRAGR